MTIELNTEYIHKDTLYVIVPIKKHGLDLYALIGKNESDTKVQTYFSLATAKTELNRILNK